MIVTPDTVLRWQRRRFREHWAKLSGRPTVGRPPVNTDISALVRKMAAAKPLWGVPRIHGELLKLGIDVAERTVSRLVSRHRPPPSLTWRTFLTNHVRDLLISQRRAGRAWSKPGCVGWTNGEGQVVASDLTLVPALARPHQGKG